jgi:hypothetical protein
VLSSFVAGVNSLGTSAGSEREILLSDLLDVEWDANGARTPLFPIIPFLPEILPAAFSESGALAANDPDRNGGSLALVVGSGIGVLPPGGPNDFTTSINSSNAIGGNSGGPVLWIPNH